MEPSKIRKSTIDTLRKALDKMGEAEWEEQIKKLSPEERENATLLKIACNFAEVALVSAQLEAISDKLKENEAKLKAGTEKLKQAFEDIKEVKEVLDAASSLLSIVAKVVAGATDPFALALKAKTFSTFSAKKAIKAGSAKMQPEFYTEEKAPLFLIEEVLHGVELTREKLIITVATGGCTNEGSFRFDINKGSGGQQPYTVTVYRIEPDECDGNFEPIPLSYSREELGIDGPVEFILRNKIGNTSQHRLNS